MTTYVEKQVSSIIDKIEKELEDNFITVYVLENHRSNIITRVRFYGYPVSIKACSSVEFKIFKKDWLTSIYEFIEDYYSFQFNVFTLSVDKESTYISIELVSDDSKNINNLIINLNSMIKNHHPHLTLKKYGGIYCLHGYLENEYYYCQWIRIYV